MFKVGDKVRCINDEFTSTVTHGHTYEVHHVSGNLLWLVGKGNHHGLYTYGAHRFELKERSDMNPETVTINGKAKPKSKGNPKANAFFVRRVGGGNPKVVHTTYKDAFNEANRLAELNPDAEFQVIGLLYSVKKVPVYTTQSTEYSV